jgi:hypothetical protein
VRGHGVPLAAPPGRTLGLLLPEAIGGRSFQEYSYVDSENVAGSVLGWNFGEGHLGDERLLACVQEQCAFEDGELRAIMVESQPILGSTLHWRIATRSAAASRRAGRRCRSSRRGSRGTTARSDRARLDCPASIVVTPPSRPSP